MGIPTRNQTFRISCSKEENDLMLERIRNSGQNKNDYIIDAVLNSSNWIHKNKIINAAATVCEISDEVNQLVFNHPEVDFTPLREEINTLCQQLS